MDELKDFIWILIALAVWVAQALAKARKAQREAAELRVVTPPLPAAPVMPLPAPVAPAEQDALRQRLLGAIVELETRAGALAAQIRYERASRRFLPVLEEWVPGETARLRAALAGPLDRRIAGVLDGLALVVDEIDELARQRRDPARALEVGDSDTLADACYEPIIDFCQAKGLPLTTGKPATQLTDFDLSIWIGFIPTSVAPIFLPPDFFRRVAWWPAIAHEIGHDFLHSVQGFDARCRLDLGLPSEEVGTRPIGFGPQGVTSADFQRVFGGWFEELFCDVFSTMMTGPAYVASMGLLFGAKNDAREVLIVDTDQSGRRYDPHPPRHLRFLAGCMVLDRMGFFEDAKRLRDAWEARHTTPEGRGPDRLLFPMVTQLLAVDLEAFTPTLQRIVERIVAGPLTGLSSMGLEDVAGLDYGPHEHAEADRARQALLRGRVPIVRDPRAIIAGAVLATLEQPALEPHILRFARDAIPAMGTGEHRHDAYDLPGAAKVGRLGSIDRDLVRDAIVLGAILDRR